MPWIIRALSGKRNSPAGMKTISAPSLGFVRVGLCPELGCVRPREEGRIGEGGVVKGKLGEGIFGKDGLEARGSDFGALRSDSETNPSASAHDSTAQIAASGVKPRFSSKRLESFECRAGGGKLFEVFSKAFAIPSRSALDSTKISRRLPTQRSRSSASQRRGSSVIDVPY
jgi:hypothetical protein